VPPPEMKKQNLYILAFKDEPLIKVGLSVDAYMRTLALGFDRFDLKSSYMVRSRDQSSISILERNLKTFFSTHQVAPPQPLSSGNTETFRSSALPQMLEAIDAFGRTFPDAEFHVDRDLSSIIPTRRDVPRLAPEERKAIRLERTTRELVENIEENERKFAAVEELLQKISVHSVEILKDDQTEFKCKIHLSTGQTDLGAQLFQAGRMIIAFETGTHHGGHSWGVNLLTTVRKEDTCTVHLCFDLKAEDDFSESIIRQDFHSRSLSLWRDFVSKHTA
jgi:hypothetical protein